MRNVALDALDLQRLGAFLSLLEPGLRLLVELLKLALLCKPLGFRFLLRPLYRRFAFRLLFGEPFRYDAVYVGLRKRARLFRLVARFGSGGRGVLRLLFRLCCRLGLFVWGEDR